VKDWDARGRKLEELWAKTSLVPVNTVAARAVLTNMIYGGNWRMGMRMILVLVVGIRREEREMERLGPSFNEWYRRQG
jgi:hypothetical protein